MAISEYLTKIKKRVKIVGRGASAGQGKSCGRGQKGQNARSGGGVRAGFEGGQTPVFRRIPKRGQMRNEIVREKVSLINLRNLEASNKFQENKTVTFPIRKTTKVLGDGTLTKKLIVEANSFAKSAREKITAVGGEWHLVRNGKRIVNSSLDKPHFVSNKRTRKAINKERK